MGVVQEVVAAPSASTLGIGCVAIDGLGGSGKSTVARRVASELGLAYLDTGATYRALTLAALESSLTIDDPVTVSRLATQLISDGRLVVERHPENPTVRLDGRDVTSAIREERVTAAVSAVSALPPVRDVFVAWQRRLAAGPGCVAEGRDVGLVVLPEAPVKFWLLADTSVRADRRAAETGTGASEVAISLSRRDSHDASRAASPARPAPDAVALDTSHLAIAEVVDIVVQAAIGAGLGSRVRG